MNDVKQITIHNAEAYDVLDQQDLSSNSHQLMSTGARKTWLKTFMQEQLPKNRLRVNEDDMSTKFESVDCNRRRKKKRGKSVASVSLKFTSVTQRQRKRCRGILQNTSNIRYETYVPLKEMWTKYIEELIQFSKFSNASLPVVSQKMMKADFHGCPLTVQKSKCASYIGVHGIVLQETKNMFVLVTPDSIVKRIPKANSIFSVVLHDCVFNIYGNQFMVKPGDRAAKKFKSKPSIDL